MRTQVLLGAIKIENIDGQFVRLTVDASPFLTQELDQMEAEGTTLAEALVNLHEQVEEIMG